MLFAQLFCKFENFHNKTLKNNIEEAFAGAKVTRSRSICPSAITKELLSKRTESSTWGNRALDGTVPPSQIFFLA